MGDRFLLMSYDIVKLHDNWLQKSGFYVKLFFKKVLDISCKMLYNIRARLRERCTVSLSDEPEKLF